MTMLEAAARSRPIVATDVGGTREIVNHGESGLLTSAEESSLADAMVKMMGLTGADLLRMGASARLHVEQSFDLDHIADTWIQLYASLA